MTLYDTKFYEDQSEYSAGSATHVLDVLLGLLPKVSSAVDVGCGVGNWAATLHRRGVDVLGVDGGHVQTEQLRIPAERFHAADLECLRFEDIGRRFDLAMSLEVAEHLHQDRAEDFVNLLCDLSDIVLFSAAIPGQGGVHHVNCQWQGYWAELFVRRDYLPSDAVRSRVWHHTGIRSHYRQNGLLYIRRERFESILGPPAEVLTDVVHPDVYAKLQKQCAYQKGRRIDVAFKRLVKRLFAARLQR